MTWGWRSDVGVVGDEITPSGCAYQKVMGLLNLWTGERGPVVVGDDVPPSGCAYQAVMGRLRLRTGERGPVSVGMYASGEIETRDCDV